MDGIDGQRAPRPQQSKHRRDQIPDRSEEDRAIKWRRGRLIDRSRPGRAEVQRQPPVPLAATEDVGCAAPVKGNLQRQVSAGAEPHQPHRFPRREVGPAQRSVADDPGTQQRRGLFVGDAGRDCVGVRGLGQHRFGIAAVDMEARESRARAQVLFVPPAELTSAAGSMQPCDAGAIPNGPIGHALPHRINRAHDLVPGDDRVGRRDNIALDRVQVGVAHAARADQQSKLAASWGRQVTQ